MKLKSLCLICVALIAFAQIASAQNESKQLPTERTQEEMIQAVQKRLAQRITKISEQIPNLKEDQLEPLTKTLGTMFLKQMSTMGKMRKLREEGASREEMMALREEMGNTSEYDQQIKEILDEEQYKAYKKAIKEMRPKRGPGQGGGMGHSGMGRGQGGGMGRGQGGGMG